MVRPGLPDLIQELSEGASDLADGLLVRLTKPYCSGSVVHRVQLLPVGVRNGHLFLRLDLCPNGPGEAGQAVHLPSGDQVDRFAGVVAVGLTAQVRPVELAD